MIYCVLFAVNAEQEGRVSLFGFKWDEVRKFEIIIKFNNFFGMFKL